MSKNRDLIQIMLIIVIGMFIPFLGSISINYGNNYSKIVMSFLYFLLIFGIELLIVYLYFYITNKYASKKIDKIK